MNSVKHAKNYTSCDYNCRLLDYIPVASTIDSLVYFIAKAYLALSSDRSKVRLGTCKCHVANKSKLRCVVLLVPVLGNIVVAMFDLCSHFKNSIEKLSNSNKSDVNNKIMSDRILKKNLSEKISYVNIFDDIEQIERDRSYFDRIDPSLKKNLKFMIEIVKIDPSLLDGLEITDNYHFMLWAYRTDPNSFDYLSSRLKNNPWFVLTLMDINDVIHDKISYNNHFLHFFKVRRELITKYGKPDAPDFIIELKNQIQNYFGDKVSKIVLDEFYEIIHIVYNPFFEYEKTQRLLKDIDL